MPEHKPNCAFVNIMHNAYIREGCCNKLTSSRDTCTHYTHSKMRNDISDDND